MAAIYAGGMVGAVARVAISRAWVTGAGHWPWATLVINVSGAFLLGYFTAQWRQRRRPASYRRPLLTTGFCGAFTTFSAVQLETVRMLDHDHVTLAVAYQAVSITAGLAAVALAAALARHRSPAAIEAAS